MARGPWKRDPITGLPLGELQKIDEQFLNADGQLNVGLFRDSSIFNVSSVCAAAFGSAVNVARVRNSMLCDPRFYHHPITDPDCRLITITTHINSAEYYGDIRRAENEDRRRANLWRGRCSPDQKVTQPVGGITSSSGGEAFSTEVRSGAVVPDDVGTASVGADGGGPSRTDIGSFFVNWSSSRAP